MKLPFTYRLQRLLGIKGDWFINLPTYIHIRGWGGWRFTSLKVLGFGVLYDHRSVRRRLRWIRPHWDSHQARTIWIDVLQDATKRE